MKITKLVLIVIINFILFGGCSNKGIYDLREGSPRKTLIKFFESWKNKDKETLKKLFYSKIPEDIVNKYLNELFSAEALLKYQISKKPLYNGNFAEVNTRFLFMKVADKPSNETEFAKKFVKKQKFILQEENRIWKIRQFQGDLDKKVEDSLFLECLNELMDIGIAQELYREKENSYAEDIELLEFPGHKVFNSCETKPKIMLEDNKYLISAITNNIEHCEISITTSSYYPKTYRECLNK